MKTLASFVAVLLGVICSAATFGATVPTEYNPNITGEAVLNGLSEKQGEDLLGFIIFLHRKFESSKLTDQEIDSIIDRLLKIEASDPYQKKTASFKGNGETVRFPNRGESHGCLFHFRFEKIANSFRKLPIAERINRIMDGIEHPPKIMNYSTTMAFRQELVSAGREAVPFIVQHEPVEPYHRRAVVTALEELADPRGIDYIVEVLQEKRDSFRLERPIAAEALGTFKDQTAVPSLVGALQDETMQMIDRDLPQVPTAGHKPYMSRYYSVQAKAAESLTKLTGKAWGFLYNEDYDTWSAWLHSDHQDTFKPAAVPRSDKEAAKLMEYMFHRYMSARPNPWQPENALETGDGVRGLSADLNQLGARVVPLIVEECHARIREMPIWKDKLEKWTAILLLTLDWPEAKNAAEGLANTK